MLRKKLFRDILKNKSQFLTIFLMTLIGVMAFAGIEAYMDGMTDTAERFYTDNNLQDINVIGNNFTKEDLENIKKISHVENAERKLELNVTDNNNKDISYLLSIIESNEISRFEVVEGEKFSKDKKGIWIDKYHADKQNIKIGDTISFKYGDYVWTEKVLGIIFIPDHVYTIKDASALFPNYSTFGTIYMSYIELEDYITREAINNSNLIPEEFKIINNEFNYEEYIPYTMLMVDVDDKANINKVKNEIETNIENALAMIEIEDTTSYSMYQGEIDEGKAFVGIFSGLFLFIAMLSVITTMTRVVKKQKLQIGTLKALGFSRKKINMHYIGYGFWVSLFGVISGLFLGRFFIGEIFLQKEMSFFEIPNGKPVVDLKSYIVAILVVLLTCIITYITCSKELKKKPAESLKNEIPKVKNGSLNITTKGIFKHLRFSSRWNIRDIIRNKFRTVTGVVGIVGCCTLIVCALGMLNSMNYFIKLQFEDLYNFNYKLSLKENLEKDAISNLTNNYGDNTSMTLNIEIKDDKENRTTNTIFVDDANDYIRYVDNKSKFKKLSSNDGVYVTYKLAETNNYKIGDTINWHIYGSKKYYNSKIVGFYRDPQVQGLTATKEYIESLDIEYKADTIYTNEDLKNTKNIENVEIIQDKKELKDSISQMLSMMKTMIIIIIFFAVILGAIIIYNMGILSYSEKQYQFSTLKVLGFDDNKISKIFTEQNSWICVLSIIIGLPVGYLLTSYLFKVCLDANYDFKIHIEWWTYVLAAIGTYIVSYIVSKRLSKRIKNIDMVSSLKANE